MAAILEASDLHKAFRISTTPHEVLRGVNVTVEQGQFVALVAPSGEGKSTLLHVLSGLDSADSGRVVIDGQDVTAMDEEQRTVFRRAHIGFVFQFFNLVPNLTAAENVALPFRIAGQRSDFDRVSELMGRLGLHGLQGHRPDEISGGEQQRIAIARALVTRPSIVMADEPTGNLDFNTGNEVLELVRSFVEEGQTVIMATHSARAAARADRVLVLKGGEIVDDISAKGASSVTELVTRLQEHGL
ncbi:MAG TPA: ABC transporter ATP-binding protein [Candidatus Dormibacteraeota bacterium]